MAEARKLPVFETIGNAITYSLKNIVLMIKLSWLWSVVVIVAAAAVLAVAGLTSGGLDTGDATALNATTVAGLVIIVPVYIIAIYSIAVGWHRGLLLGEEPGWLYLHVGRREFLYLGYAIAIFLIAASGIVVAGAIIAASAGIGGDNALLVGAFVVLTGVGVVVMALVLGRLHLVLPGAAVGDRRMSLRSSFELTRGNSWRIAGGFLLIALLNGVVNVFSGLLESSAESAPVVTVALLVVIVIVASIVVAFITLSYMSYCYWHFVPPPEEGDLV